MNRAPLSLRWRIATALIFAAVAVTPLAILADRVFGREVVLVPNHVETAALGRVLAVPADSMAENARSVDGRPVRVLLLTPRDVIHPAHDPSLSLLPVGRNRRPLEVQTVFSFARSAIVALLAIATVMLLAGRESILRVRAAMTACEQARLNR